MIDNTESADPGKTGKPDEEDDGVVFNVHFDDQNPPTPVTWPNLTKKEITERLLELRDWTAWLIHRYHLDTRTIPECWSSHGELIEELSALYGGWCTANSWDKTGADTLQWHTDFATARERLTEWTARNGCRPGHHRKP